MYNNRFLNILYHSTFVFACTSIRLQCHCFILHNHFRSCFFIKYIIISIYYYSIIHNKIINRYTDSLRQRFAIPLTILLMLLVTIGITRARRGIATNRRQGGKCGKCGNILRELPQPLCREADEVVARLAVHPVLGVGDQVLPVLLEVRDVLSHLFPEILLDFLRVHVLPKTAKYPVYTMELKIK